MLGGDASQGGVETGQRRDGAHVAGAGLGDDAGDLVAELSEDVLDRRDVVVGHDDRVGCGGAGDTGRRGQPQGRDAGAGVGQQRIAVPVVAAGELDDLGAARVAAGQPDRAHGGLGAGVHQPDPLDRCDAADDLGGEFGLRGRRSAEGQAVGRDALDGVDDGGVRVPEDHRPPRTHQVDVFVAVGVGQPVAAGRRDEPRGAADRVERPDRRVHPAGDDGARVGEQRSRRRCR